MNQELNFHSQDNNLVIRGGCDLFTTKPMSADRKLFKTIDKHLDQILEDSQLSQSLERERQHSINSLFGSSVSPPPSNPGTRRGSYASERDRRNSASLINFRRGSILNTTINNNNSNLSKSLSGSTNFEASCDESAIDESPFGPLKNVTTRKTFSYLIAILNTTYPDHDFSNLQPSTENFHKLSSPEELIRRFNNLMVSLGKKEDLLEWVWDIVNLYMDIIPKNSGTNGVPRSRHNSMNGGNAGLYTPLSPAESPPNANSFDGCQIYEFQPTDQSILEDLNYPYQAMWSYYWFIYNKKKKRVTFLYLTGINKIHYSQVNNGRSSSFSRRRKLRSAGGDALKDNIADDDDDDGEVYLDDYMDEEVFLDDEVEDDDIMEDDVIGDLEM